MGYFDNESCILIGLILRMRMDWEKKRYRRDGDTSLFIVNCLTLALLRRRVRFRHYFLRVLDILVQFLLLRPCLGR